MSATGGGREPSGRREYRCQREGCGGLLCVSDATWGAIEAVYCPKCHQRQTVFLGGRRQAGAGTTRVGKADPRNPPVEDGPVRPWRRG